jgi:hypothetical protein
MGTLSNDVGELRFSDPGVIRATASDRLRRDLARRRIVGNLGRRRQLTTESAATTALAIPSSKSSDIGNAATT